MDVETVKTFLAVAEFGQFQEAAAELGVTQQAISKRVSRLESELGVRVFARTPRGAQLSVDGQAFLPHARELVQVAERAVDSVHPGRRALRVDVLHRRIAPSVLMREFHRSNPHMLLDVVTLGTASVIHAIDAIRAGTIDASFRAVLHESPDQWTDIVAPRVFESRMEVLVGPHHPLASAKSLAPHDLRAHRIWIPGILPGTEWAHYYDRLAADFDLSIDGVGPHFGDEALLEEIADSKSLMTFVGDRDRYLWPTHFDLRRIPLRDPAPIYPYSLVYRKDNAHPAIPGLLNYFKSLESTSAGTTWLP
ncbi:LysR family transcriptional regulator [Brevibacterium marinum]|uniref:DNA-binding transcriptional LysR family regulator n=1 Tax=Brevibacterium marinum TaxID=418643 RepID=A0A846S8V2_9MICO|nr:LysR family transcriptional regulator [Brevibacterium marinum]NJC57227.1 DNA-binding transcriptional LysR family regulator [Brevibacterium marinum]